MSENENLLIQKTCQVFSILSNSKTVENTDYTIDEIVDLVNRNHQSNISQKEAQEIVDAGYNYCLIYANRTPIRIGYRTAK